MSYILRSDRVGFSPAHTITRGRRRRSPRTIDAQALDRRNGSPVRLTWTVAPETPPLNTDEIKLRTVVRNLIDNAMKFTGSGSVTVSACARHAGVEITV